MCGTRFFTDIVTVSLRGILQVRRATFVDTECHTGRRTNDSIQSCTVVLSTTNDKKINQEM